MLLFSASSAIRGIPPALRASHRVTPEPGSPAFALSEGEPSGLPRPKLCNIEQSEGSGFIYSGVCYLPCLLPFDVALSRPIAPPEKRIQEAPRSTSSCSSTRQAWGER